MVRINAENPPIMKWARSIKFLSRGLLVLLLLALVFLGIAFLPGNVEGNYRGLASSCGCDSVTFLNLRDGLLIEYRSAHPPATIMGRFQMSENGVVDVWLTNWREGEPDKLIFKAYPRFLITRFVAVEGGQASWHWKWPSIGNIGESLRFQEIHSTILKKEGTWIREVYDRDLRWIRHETKIGKGKWMVESGGSTSDGLTQDEEKRALQRELQRKELEAAEFESEIADLKKLLEDINPRLQLLETEKARISEQWKNSKLKLDAELKGLLEEPSVPLHETFRRMSERMEKLMEENEELKRRIEGDSR